ncbi:Holliday junction branch migration protein RuvA [Mycoplasmopsis primatum]|uniref:Holliday junction branch migration protein RuvA n=1 Tax=Mycoplasmopsis primatum TaxID=55604 RepID=UPI00068E38F0|nr:Holliday junction branch migration protein RuvA [Mycoplasmopsis primatum]
MLIYRVGRIIQIDKSKSKVFFESNDTGYEFIVPNIDYFQAGKQYILYLYEIKTEYYCITYAFKEYKERLLFIDLLSVNGIGPSTAFAILNSNGYEKVLKLICKADINGLSKLPYMNGKRADAIVDDLSRKWENADQSSEPYIK